MFSGFVPSDCFSKKRKKSTLPLFVVAVSDFDGWRDSAPPSIKKWLVSSKFRARAGASCLLPADAGPAGAVVTVDDASCLWQYANLPSQLPLGDYEAEPELPADMANALALGWVLGSYRFERYKRKKTKRPTLVFPESTEQNKVLALAEGICLARDLINTPASDMGPEELAAAVKSLGKEHGATVTTIVGDALLKKNYPMIHAVGRASPRAPRLVDLRWGKEKGPLLTLVGKGVCFDTGGLDLKPGPYMKLMKKDMGGAALMIGLAHALMKEKFPIRLRMLIPAVENSVAGNAMRPLDVLESRKGITVEVGDTDAEGRLILADALVEADRESPDLIIDAATLTGAARVAVGTGMPAVFSRLDETWRALERVCDDCADPMWRLPLFSGYRSKLNSKVADISNIANDAYAGAIVAALFLAEFVDKNRDWLHLDTMGFNVDSRPGRPVGGEALGLMTLHAMLTERYASCGSAPPPDQPQKKVSVKKKTSATGRPGQKAKKKARARN